MNGYSNLGTSRISHGRDSYVTQKKHISVRHVAIDVYTYIYIYHIYILSVYTQGTLCVEVMQFMKVLYVAFWEDADHLTEQNWNELPGDTYSPTSKNKTPLFFFHNSGIFPWAEGAFFQ